MMLDFSRTWLPFIYLYGVGGIIFILGMVLVLRSRSLNLKRRYHRIWLFILFLGFAWYVVLHSTVSLAALGYESASAVIILLFLFVMIFLYLVVTAMNRQES
tara:strand:+ start:74 stop:379 length:306 start_codon:yes stop_codon:yes gene_type:complete